MKVEFFKFEKNFFNWFNPTDYVNNISEYLRLQKEVNKYKNGRFFIDTTVQFLNVEFHKGEFSTKTVIEHENCFVSVYSGKAYIQLENSFKIISKNVYSKHFSMFGKEVTKDEFNKHLKEIRIAHNW